jgi:Flp pilus assembly protein TadG
MLKRLKSWLRKDSGVVAIEFAMLSMPFIVLLMGIVEISVLYASSIVLEGGAAEAGRLIRTGQAQGSTDPEAAFKDKLCDEVSGIIPCAQIQYEVIKMADNAFPSIADYAPQFDAAGNFIPQGFNAGSSSDVILIRAVYQHDFLVPFLGILINGTGSQKVTLMSTTVIKNEPFTFGS